MAKGNLDEVFNRTINTEKLAITADEFTLTNERTADFDWRDVDLTGHLSRNIEAPNPFLASPMTTISETKMGVAMAMLGGGAVIHAAMTPDEQFKMVRKVKLHLNGVVEEPISINASDSIEHALNERDRRDFKFWSFPVVDENDRFTGMMTETNFDLFRDQNSDMPIGEAMRPTEEITTAPTGTTMEQAYQIMREGKIKILPILDEDQRVSQMYLLSDVRRVLFGNPENYNLDKNGRLRTFAAVTTHEDDFSNPVERLKNMSKYLDMVVIDTSHGESRYAHSALKKLKRTLALLKEIREDFSGIDIMVGNVSDPEAAAELAKHGPDAIRIGRGPGGICISRERLGGGMPQATAVYLGRRAVHAIDPGIKICADGGLRGPGDAIKLFAVGADCEMFGGYVAGTDEAAAPVMTRADGSQYKDYYGEGSAKAQLKNLSSRLRYDPSAAESFSEEDIFIEGVEKEIPLQGPVSRKINDLTRGLKIEMCTNGCKTISALQEEVNIIRVTSAGANEGKASA
jgi:IMP dehydrogenase